MIQIICCIFGIWKSPIVRMYIYIFSFFLNPRRIWQIFENISLINFIKQKPFISEVWVWPKIRARVKFMHLVFVVMLGQQNCVIFFITKDLFLMLQDFLQQFDVILFKATVKRGVLKVKFIANIYLAWVLQFLVLSKQNWFFYIL